MQSRAIKLCDDNKNNDDNAQRQRQRQQHPERNAMTLKESIFNTPPTQCRTLKCFAFIFSFSEISALE